MKKAETTISVNGGPEVPLAVAEAAVDAILAAKPKTETRSLMCRLTDDEQRVRGIELADAQKRMVELAEEKREVGERIKATEATIDRLAEAVKHRQEELPVTCTLEPDYGADWMTIRRTDTGRIDRWL